MNTSKFGATIGQKKRPYQVLLNLKQSVSNAFDTLQYWQERAEQRHELKGLIEDADRLKDIGLSKNDVIIEANKKFWQK
ncbi:DUF1127 domain-containing protein [Psychromonas sp. KJ10-10]|uniref:DUF1127 domain-containing protein n=1 Tax=Psychromonas sp. KJ10-10 TaxID=3391823 RepID=UPI0039B5A59E